MPNIKQIILDASAPDITVYCVVQRQADSYFLNDADGAFAAAPADFAITMTEDTNIGGKYTKSESRTVWVDGIYSVYVYQQLGGSPAASTDMMIGDGEMVIENDLEITGNISSLPWTGTDSVQTVLNNVMPRIATAAVDIYTAVNSITDLIFKRLWRRKSDLVVSSLTLVLEAGISDAPLPSYFMGLKGKPFDSADGTVLEPLQQNGRAGYHLQTGLPERYDLRQGTLSIFPTPTATTVIQCEYFRNPGKVSALADIIPFTGMFFDVYTEGIVEFAAQNRSLAMNQAFAQFLEDEINAVLPARSSSLPTYRTTKFF